MEQTNGTITISNVNLTTILYETVNVEDISKTIYLQNSTKSEDTKTINDEGKSTQNNENEKQASQVSNSDIQTTEISNNKQNISNTNSKNIIPQLGTNKIVIFSILFFLVVIIVTIRIRRKI